KEPLASQGHQGRITYIAISTDGRTVTSGSAEGALCRWEAATGKQGPLLHGLAECRRILAVSPDGMLLAFRHQDRSVRLWDLAGAKALHQWPSPEEDLASCAAFSPDGTTLAVGYSKQPSLLVRLSAANKESRSSGPHGVHWLAFSPDNKTLALAGADGK